MLSTVSNARIYLFGLEKAGQNVENAPMVFRPPGSSARHFMALRTTRHSGRRTFHLAQNAGCDGSERCSIFANA
jgi:hypothetical protein